MNRSVLRSALIFLAAAVVVGVASWLAIPRLLPYSYHGAQAPDGPARDFTLTRAGGQTVRLSDFRGKLVVLYFGYTHCPDVCPTTMAELGEALRRLGQGAEGVQVIMVTVDPERDTPERLADYLSYFNPTFLGLGGSPEEIATAARAFDIYYQKNEVSGASGYLVDHTATTTVVGRDGRTRLLWPYGTPADDLAADLRHLLAEAP